MGYLILLTTRYTSYYKPKRKTHQITQKTALSQIKKAIKINNIKNTFIYSQHLSMTI